MISAPLALSLEVALLATLIAGTLGIAVGALLALRRFPGRDLLDVLITTPLVLPPTVLGYYVLVSLGRRSPLGALFERLTGGPIVFTRTAAVIAATIGALPLITKSARAALEAVDPTLGRAARTLGAGPLRTFFTVQAPLALRGLVAGLMLGFARSLGDFGVTLMVAGDIPGETQTAALAVYDALQAQRDAEAAGLVAVLSAVVVLVLYLVNKLTLTGRRNDL
ncbi:MAG TPA: molybdate ABC transporter permease subunit [Polyangia bacterium]|nr:molybdate ABC transporter permease subunit [Polyangia bacterium]